MDRLPMALAALCFSLAVTGCGDDEISDGPQGGSGGDGGETGDGGADTGGGGGGTGGADVPAPIVSVVSPSDASTSEHEPQIILGDDGRIVAVWNAFNPDPTNFYHVQYRISDDLGETWGPVTPIPLMDDNNIGSNTTLARADDGTIYFAFATEYVNQQGVRSAQRVWLTKLAPDDDEFGEPVEITDPSAVVGVYDQPAITVTPEGNLLITYGEGPPSLDSLILVTQFSDDGGETWTRTAPTEPVQYEYMNLFHPCISKDANRVYLLHTSSDIGVSLWRSEDGGRTFPPENRIAVQAPDETETASYMVDGNCVAEGDEVWAVYGLTDTPNPGSGRIPRLTGIVIAHSSDGGETIDRRSRAEDPEVGPKYLLPRIAHEGGGIIDVTFYAGMRQGDETASYRTTRSTDGGETFGPSELIYEPVRYELARDTEQWLGDYMGVAHADGVLYGVFTDNLAPKAHISFFSYQR